MKELQYLNKYFVKYKNRFLLGIFITIVAQIFSLFIPKLVSHSMNIIDAYLKNPTSDISFIRKELLISLGLILGATIIAGVLTFLMRQTLIVMSRYVEFDLKNEVFQQYERLSQHFYKNNRTGDLMNRISEDVGKVRMYVGTSCNVHHQHHYSFCDCYYLYVQCFATIDLIYAITLATSLLFYF